VNLPIRPFHRSRVVLFPHRVLDEALERLVLLRIGDRRIDYRQHVAHQMLCVIAQLPKRHQPCSVTVDDDLGNARLFWHSLSPSVRNSTRLAADCMP
jgi:hypothetical protein